MISSFIHQPEFSKLIFGGSGSLLNYHLLLVDPPGPRMPVTIQHPGARGVVPTSTVVGWWRFQQQIIRLFTTRGEIWSMFNGILLEGPRLRDLKKNAQMIPTVDASINLPITINLSNKLGKLPNLKWIRNIGFLFTKQHHQWSHGPLTSTALVMVDGCLAQSWHTTASRWVHNMGLFFDRKMVDLQVVCICYLQVVEIGNLRNKNLYL